MNISDEEISEKSGKIKLISFLANNVNKKDLFFEDKMVYEFTFNIDFELWLLRLTS